jgi:uncharacterized protein DUF1629
MATYYRFHRDNEAPLKGLRLAQPISGPQLGVTWGLGTKIKKAVPTPVRCTIDAAKGATIPDIFFWKIPLYSDRLLAALTNAGVDNLETYDAEIANHESSEVRTDFKATNVVGKIECVNLKKSEFDKSSEFPMIEFSKIVLNEKKIGKAKMFRLAENPLFIVVSQEVRDALAGDEWIGLSITSLDDDDAY